jgi:hypothetical protein
MNGASAPRLNKAARSRPNARPALCQLPCSARALRRCNKPPAIAQILV